MHNPFAVAMQWPDQPRRYLVHLQRPYFTAAIYETASAAWLTVSWAPTQARNLDAAPLFRQAAEFCRHELAQMEVPIEFIERKHGHHLPRFLIAQTSGNDLFIVEPEHSTPLVEVRERKETASNSTPPRLSQRFDIITQWRLAQMRSYYQQFLERQQNAAVKSRAFVPGDGGK